MPGIASSEVSSHTFRTSSTRPRHTEFMAANSFNGRYDPPTAVGSILYALSEPPRALTLLLVNDMKYMTSADFFKLMKVRLQSIDKELVFPFGEPLVRSYIYRGSFDGEGKLHKTGPLTKMGMIDAEDIQIRGSQAQRYRITDSTLELIAPLASLEIRLFEGLSKEDALRFTKMLDSAFGSSPKSALAAYVALDMAVKNMTVTKAEVVRALGGRAFKITVDEVLNRLKGSGLIEYESRGKGVGARYGLSGINFLLPSRNEILEMALEERKKRHNYHSCSEESLQYVIDLYLKDWNLKLSKRELADLFGKRFGYAHVTGWNRADGIIGILSGIGFLKSDTRFSKNKRTEIKAMPAARTLHERFLVPVRDVAHSLDPNSIPISPITPNHIGIFLNSYAKMPRRNWGKKALLGDDQIISVLESFGKRGFTLHSFTRRAKRLAGVRITVETAQSRYVPKLLRTGWLKRVSRGVYTTEKLLGNEPSHPAL